MAVSGLALTREVARAEIETRLAQLTGLDVTVEGAADFTLLPRTRISMTRIRIGSSSGSLDAVMRIDGIVADLDLWQALLGHTRIERLSVIRPELLSTAGFMQASATPAGAAGSRLESIDGSIDRRPGSAEAKDIPAHIQMTRYLGAFLSRFEALRSIEIRHGVFRMAAGGGSSGVSNANLVVSWPSQTSAARMSGSYVWNGQPTEINLRFAAPLAFLSGETSGVDLDLSSPALTVAFDGEGAIGGARRFTGTLKVATPSLTRSIRWLGDPRAVLPEIGPLSIEAAVEGTGRDFNLRDAIVMLDGFTGRGAVEMRVAEGGRPTLGGTLAFDRLDLTGFAEAVAPLPRDALALQRPIPVDFIDRLDLDLRLSASRGAIGTVPMGELAATLNFQDGVATLDIGDATVLDGSGQARISVDSRAPVPTARGFASVRGIDTSGLFQAIGVSSIGVSGLSDIRADIEAPVTSWREIFKRNKMTVSIAARGGELSGFDPDVFLGDGTKPFAFATRETSIPFETLQAAVTTTGPLAELKNLTLRNASGSFEATGHLSTATNQLDVSGWFVPRPGTTASILPDLRPAPRPIGFRMRGEWPRPIITSGPPAEPI